MRGIDEIHLKYPFYGSRRVRNELRDRGFKKVGRGHVATLMKKMGIMALYPKPRTSKPNPAHKVYPYLLKGLNITQANHVWCADITYLPMAKGFSYSFGHHGLTQAEKRSHGGSLIRLIHHFAWRRFKKLWIITEHRRYSTPTRRRNLPL